MDQVYIEALEVETLIGVYDFERVANQTLFLDIELAFDCSRAGATDELEFALDYDRLSRLIRQWCLEQRFALLEAFAESLCQLIHQEFGIESIKLKINKPAAVENCRAVGISIKRNFG